MIVDLTSPRAVDPLWFHEDHRIRIGDRRVQHVACIRRGRRTDDLEAGDVAEKRFRRIGMELWSTHTASEGDADDYRRGRGPGGPPGIARRVYDDLLERR